MIIFTKLEAIAFGFDTNFIGMLLMFIPAIGELLLMSCIAIGGGYWMPAMVNKGIAEADEMGTSGIVNVIMGSILKIVLGVLFLGVCYMFVQNHYPSSYNRMFQGTIYDSVMKIPASWIENFCMWVIECISNQI